MAGGGLEGFRDASIHVSVHGERQWSNHANSLVVRSRRQSLSCGESSPVVAEVHGRVCSGCMRKWQLRTWLLDCWAVGLLAFWPFGLLAYWSIIGLGHNTRRGDSRNNFRVV
jgi:hypothetical protein